MIDYNAIRNNINTYYRYTLSNGSITTVSLEKPHTIGNSTDLIESSNISIGNTYNKVSLEADVYPFDKMIPDLFNDVE
jgi:hypothetical protein